MPSAGDTNDNLGPTPWRRRLEQLLSSRRKLEALGLLDEVINDAQLVLFDSESVHEEERRLAWLNRIDVLRDMRRFHEALAWVCLECELNPKNVTAQGLKARLKRQVANRGVISGARQRYRVGSSQNYWPGVAGMRQLKATLERDVLLPQREPELYATYRLKLPNGILLYGPPGCGKTFIARKLAAVLGFSFIEVSPSDLGSIYVHGTQGKIGDLFREAREKTPCMLFFDELDALIPDRGDNLSHHYSAEVNEFLVQMNEAAAHRLLIVAATNRLDKIDAAALRPGRLDKKIFVGPPDLEARTELLALYLTDRPQESLNLLELAKEADGFTCAELEHVVNEAARRALKSMRPISRDDVLAALAANPPVHVGAKPEDG